MEGSVMNIARQSAPAKGGPHRIGCLTAHPRRKPPILGFDHVVDNLAAALTRTGARRVETAVLDRPVSLAVDEEEMDEAFAILGNAMAQDTLVTILAALVGTNKTGEEDGRRGCALLSVRVTGAQGAAKRGLGDGLPVVLGVIKKQGGSFRFSEGTDEEVRLSLYLPVLHS
jgi:hypothetical protein